jgi:hypothetical protein
MCFNEEKFYKNDFFLELLIIDTCGNLSLGTNVIKLFSLQLMRHKKLECMSPENILAYSNIWVGTGQYQDLTYSQILVILKFLLATNTLAYYTRQL